MQNKRKQLWNTHEKNGEKMETTMDKKRKTMANKWNNYGTQMNKLYGQKMDKLWKKQRRQLWEIRWKQLWKNMDTTMANIWKQLWKNNGQTVETY